MIAKKLELPVVIHLRSSEQEQEQVTATAIDIIQTTLSPQHPICIHSFVGSVADMENWLLNFDNVYFGISPASMSEKNGKDTA